ncbi:MAG: ATP phosphoribosyltransferase regulatory subunit [Patescibacteria group bacterium]|nr:ATP phosphoribosyltransferase regulatory subunit [Patescibacteria group bacterium]
MNQRTDHKPGTEGEQRSSKGASRFVPIDHLDKIGEVAMYYGFSPIKSPAISKADLDAAKGITDGDYIDDETESHGKMPLRVEEKIALIRTYHEEDWASLTQPVCLYLKDPCRGIGSAGAKKSPHHRYADLEIIGASGPIAEATLVQAGRAMLAEEGYADTRVEVNSVGDRDSLARFSRELTAYYRKCINDMTPECRQLFKKGPFELLSSHDSACAEINDKAPRAMNFLSEASRRHLEEVLEYLESLGVPYSINNGLIGNRSYGTETIFSIVAADGDGAKGAKGQRVLGIGVRYNGLAKRLGMKKDIQGVGLSLLIKESGRGLRGAVKRIKRPIASFVQLGIESKLMSLDVIERLRKAKIPLYLSLAKDRLGAQVSTVERYHTPYVIVIGKKEAVERSAIVRRVDTYSQETVPIDDLPDYMKRVERKHWGR